MYQVQMHIQPERQPRTVAESEQVHKDFFDYWNQLMLFRPDHLQARVTAVSDLDWGGEGDTFIATFEVDIELVEDVLIEVLQFLRLVPNPGFAPVNLRWRSGTTGRWQN